MSISQLADRTTAPSPHGPDGLHLLPVVTSVADGRRWVGEQARAAGACDEVIDVAVLLTSELVTNAVRHSPMLGTITVRANRHGDVLDVAVIDDNRFFPVVRNPGPQDGGGRGLLLVQALAAQWGVEMRGGSGKSVWFRLALEPDLA